MTILMVMMSVVFGNHDDAFNYWTMADCVLAAQGVMRPPSMRPPLLDTL